MRRFAVRVGVLLLLVAGVFATRLAVTKPQLPFVVLASLDRAFADKPTIFDVLDLYEAELLVQSDAATEALDRALAQLDSLPPDRKHAALFETMKHLTLARGDLAHAPTAEELAEYDATCERLRDVRRLLA